MPLNKKSVSMFLVALAAVCINSVVYAQLVQIWSTPKTLNVPESVMFDKKNNVLYVANINGMPTEKNGKGFIARVGLDGTVLEKQWITGFNAPKGMGILKNTLFVTDIDRIHAIDIKKSKISQTYSVAGAQFLNDIAIDAKGVVYISDSETHTLYRLYKGKVSRWLDLRKYQKTNGLFLKGKILYVGTNSGIVKVYTKTKKSTLFIPLTGGIDGLKEYKGDSFIVSDWKGKVQLVGKNKKPRILNDTTAQKINAADFEYIKKKHMIIVPTFFDNRVAAYSVK